MAGHSAFSHADGVLSQSVIVWQLSDLDKAQRSVKRDRRGIIRADFQRKRLSASVHHRLQDSVRQLAAQAMAPAVPINGQRIKPARDAARGSAANQSQAPTGQFIVILGQNSRMSVDAAEQRSDLAAMKTLGIVSKAARFQPQDFRQIAARRHAKSDGSSASGHGIVDKVVAAVVPTVMATAAAAAKACPFSAYPAVTGMGWRVSMDLLSIRTGR